MNKPKPLRQLTNLLSYPLYSLMALLNIFILFPGCSEEPVPKHLEPELFAKIYSEAILESQNSAKEDSLAHLTEALDKFKVTRKEFEASIDYYKNNPVLWLEVFDKVVEDLEKKKTAGDAPNGTELKRAN